MFYYSFNINDYRAATAHLSNEEDLAYRRMLDLYYEKEGAIPADPAKLARLVRSSQVDVETVLGEFFKLVDGAYRHDRCDFELSGMIARAEKARANGKLGGRRRDEPAGYPAGSHPVPTGNHVGSQDEPTAIPEPSYPNTPIPQHPSTPEREKAPRKRGTSGDEVKKPDDVMAELWEAWLAVRKRKRAPLTEVAWAGVLRETAKAGWHINEVVRKMAERNWQSVEADWLAKESRSGGSGKDSIVPKITPADYYADTMPCDENGFPLSIGRRG